MLSSFHVLKTVGRLYPKTGRARDKMSHLLNILHGFSKGCAIISRKTNVDHFFILILFDSGIRMCKNPVLLKRWNLSIARNEVQCHAMVLGRIAGFEL
jgi:hypothetical protein